MSKTIEHLQGGKSRFKWVALIEGVPGYVLSDASQAAITTCFAGTDWANAVRAQLFVDLQNEQKLTPWSAFTSHGRCTLRVYDPTDAFATFVNKRLSGVKAELTQTYDRNDTTLETRGVLGSGGGIMFPASGTAYIGTETFTYSGISGSSFTGVTRGIASPFGCDSSGSGGSRFGGYHRYGADVGHTQAAPLVTQLPRTWIGRRVGLWMHTEDSDGVLNSKADAQLVFAGRIATLSDDPATFHTVIDLEHMYETDFKKATIGKDLFAATIPEGLQLCEGRVFEFSDSKQTAVGTITTLTANTLTVVSGTPASVNQIQVGWYTAGELCDRISAWLGSELNAGRIYGHYRWASPVSSNVGLRTKCYWKIEHASRLMVDWEIKLPGEVAAFLGLTDESGDLRGQQVPFGVKAVRSMLAADNPRIREGKGVPYHSMMFYPYGPGRLAQEFGDAITYAFENGRGVFQEQYDMLPYAVKGSCDSSLDWGIFLFDERVLIVGAYDNSTPTSPVLKNCFIAPFQFVSANTGEALSYIGRRLDEQESGAVTIRQVLIFEQNWAQLLLRIAYSSGTSGYNHGTHDTLSYGCGLNIPGSLLGPEFERSLLNLPGADMPAVVVIDEPTTFADLFQDDMIFRWAFVRWRDQGFEIGEWKTPIASGAALSYAGETLELVEANKADADPNADHRVASTETDEHLKAVVRIDHSRDFGGSRESKFSKSVQIEDQRAVDDAGGSAKPFIIKLRHTFRELAATGAAVDKLLPEFIARMPMASRATRKIVRTIDQRYYEGYGVGDIVGSVDDHYARDPVTGVRGISSRPAIITRLSYSPGGPPFHRGKPRPQFGEVELMFLDLQRGTDYAPAAEVDETQANGGYNAGTSTLTCYAHAYSHDISGLGLRRGGTTSDTEDVDASNFPAGSKIHIIEMDPANPASPTLWERTVSSQSGNTITLTAALSAPAWSSTLKYRIVPQKYSQVVAAQQEVAYQAAEGDFMVEDTTPPWDYSTGGKGLSFEATDSTGLAEFIPDVAAGDGRPYDSGFDTAIAHSLNAFIDRKSAHQSPFLIGPGAIAGTLGSSEWELMFIRPIYLGTEHLTSTVQRVLKVAAMFQSATGASVSVRVRIGRTMPSEGPGTLTGAGTYYQNPTFSGEFAASSAWTTSSTTEQTGASKTIEINCKDLFFGYVFLIVEVQGDMYCRGLATCIEGPRVVG